MSARIPLSDMQTIQKEEPEPAVRINRDGGVAILAKSTPIVMKQLGDPLVEDILSPDTPDDQCLTLTLRNTDGTVADVKCRKPVEVIRDPDHPLVKQRMANHGKGTEGYLPWCDPNEYSKRSLLSTVRWRAGGVAHIGTFGHQWF